MNSLAISSPAQNVWTITIHSPIKHSTCVTASALPKHDIPTKVTNCPCENDSLHWEWRWHNDTCDFCLWDGWHFFHEILNWFRGLRKACNYFHTINLCSSGDISSLGWVSIVYILEALIISCSLDLQCSRHTEQKRWLLNTIRGSFSKSLTWCILLLDHESLHWCLQWGHSLLLIFLIPEIFGLLES